MAGALLERHELNKLRESGFVWDGIERGLFTREFTGVSVATIPSVSIDSVSLSILEPESLIIAGFIVDVSPYMDLLTTERPELVDNSQGSDFMNLLPDNVNATVSNGSILWGEYILADGIQGSFSGDIVDLNWDDGGLRLVGDSIDMSVEQFLEAERGGLTAEAMATISVSGIMESLTSATVFLREAVVRGELLSKYPVSISDIEIELTQERVARVVTQQGGLISVNLLGDTPNITMEDVSVSELLSYIGSVIPEIDEADVSGVISGTLSFPNLLPTFEVEGLSVSGAVDHISALRRGPFTHRVPTEGGGVGIRSTGEGVVGWTPLRDISPYMAWAVVAAEDSNYWSHDGYDPASISDAIIANSEAGGVVRGGSTLTQQLAKNLFLSGEQTLTRKIRELIIAVELDRALGKDRVMELYLNVVEWGPDIYGVAEAAEAYFMKRPSQLTGKESAFLAAILPSPRRFYRDWYLRNRAGEYRVAWVLENMANAGDISHSEARELENGRLLFVPPPVQ